eukprot:scaffold10819_cov108-Isochrysis_galbana.AAC.1
MPAGEKSSCSPPCPAPPPLLPGTGAGPTHATAPPVPTLSAGAKARATASARSRAVRSAAKDAGLEHCEKRDGSGCRLYVVTARDEMDPTRGSSAGDSQGRARASPAKNAAAERASAARAMSAASLKKASAAASSSAEEASSCSGSDPSRTADRVAYGGKAVSAEWGGRGLGVGWVAGSGRAVCVPGGGWAVTSSHSPTRPRAPPATPVEGAGQGAPVPCPEGVAAELYSAPTTHPSACVVQARGGANGGTEAGPEP